MGKKQEPKYKLGCCIEGLKYLVSLCEIDGEWVFENNYYQFKVGGITRISFYPTKGTLLFQEPELSFSKIENMVICIAIEERVLV